MSPVLLLLLLISYINEIKCQLSNSNSKCISNTTTIWCITIHSTTNVNYISSGTIYPDEVYPYFCDDYGDSNYYYYHQKVDQTDGQSSITWSSTTHCFDGTSRDGSCINIAYDPISPIVIGQSNLYNLNKWSIDPKTISIPLDKSSISHNDESRILLTNYKSITQCIEILNGRFPRIAANDYLFGPNQFYFVEGYILRSSNNDKIINIENEWNINDQDPTKILKISTSSDDGTFNPIFNELFCFASIPEDNIYIHIELQLSSYYDNNKYPLKYIIIDTSQYIERMDYRLNLMSYNNSNTYLDIGYWQRCDFMTYFTGNTNGNNDNSVNNDNNIYNNPQDIEIKDWSETLSNLSSTFLIIVSMIGFIIIIIVSLLSMRCYPAGDPINYFALIWMVLELWDFWSDISFTIYLYIISLYYPTPFLILLIISTICVIMPFLLNISYFQHLINLWSKQPHCCRAPQTWLKHKYYYIYFLLISLITGGVFPAIELTNSVLMPHPLFSMGVPYFELVRVRTERFITNVLFENLPFLILQILFYYAIKSLNSNILIQTVGGFVFLGTVLSSVLSVLFSGTYFFSYKGKSALPIAVYRLEIHFECEDSSNYWKYSFWRMQTAISKAFQVSSPTLIMIDSCNMYPNFNGNKNKIEIHCRLLYDEAPFGNQTNIQILLRNKNDHSVTGDLSGLFKKEFQLNKIKEIKQKKMNKSIDNNNNNEIIWNYNTSNLRVTHCAIGKINGDEGELVYDYIGQSLLKSICCYICNRIKGKPSMNRMSTRDVIALHKKRQNSRQPKPNINKQHIRNVSAMKAAYSKNKKLSDADNDQKKIIPSFKPNVINTTTNNQHHRIDSNISYSNNNYVIQQHQHQHQHQHQRNESNISVSNKSGISLHGGYSMSNNNNNRSSRTYDKPLPVNSPSGSSHFQPTFSPNSPSSPNQRISLIQEVDEDQDEEQQQQQQQQEQQQEEEEEEEEYGVTPAPNDNDDIYNAPDIDYNNNNNNNMKPFNYQQNGFGNQRTQNLQ